MSLVTTGLSPTLIQFFYFTFQAEGQASDEVIAFGRQRYTDEMLRLVGVLDFRLREYEYLAKTYTIADMAAYPWIARHEAYGISLDDFVGVRNWYNRLIKRPAVQRGLDRDIENLGSVVKLINISLVPLLLTAFVLIAGWRRSRATSA